MRLYGDDSHIVEEQELREDILESALEDEDNSDLIEEGILNAIRNDYKTMVYLFNEVRSFGEMEDRFIDELIQREVNKRSEV